MSATNPSVIEDIFIVQGRIKKDIKKLTDQLSVVDKKISDIHHYIEVKTLDACSGFHMYKLLQETLLERRNIKDEMACLQILSDKMSDSVQKYNQKKSDMSSDDRMYSVRVMIDRFGNCIKGKKQS